MWRFFLAALACHQAVAIETPLEMQVLQNLTLLEDQVYFPINRYLSTLTSEFESAMTNYSIYEQEGHLLMTLQINSIIKDIDAVSAKFEENKIDINKCLENVMEHLEEIFQNSGHQIATVILDGVSAGQKIIADARAVFVQAQNRTAEVREVVRSCMSLSDDEDCLVEVLETLIMMQHTVPAVISTAGRQHLEQLTLLEEGVVANVELYALRAIDDALTVLDNFLICSLQWQNE